MKEFAFDVQIQAVIRVNAKTEREARAIVESIQAFDWSNVEARDGFNINSESLIVLDNGNTRVTEISTIPESISLFETI